MSIYICGVNEVPLFAEAPLDHIISIRDKNQPRPDIRNFKTEFTLHAFNFEDTGSSAHPEAPSEQHIKRLLNLYSSISVEQNILFHCYAGVSRSTAAAFIFAVAKGVPYQQSFEFLEKIRGPIICPNQLMVKIADNLMGHNGNMERFLNNILKEREPVRDASFKSFGGIAPTYERKKII